MRRLRVPVTGDPVVRKPSDLGVRRWLEDHHLALLLDDALGIVNSWLVRSNVAIVSLTEQHWLALSKLLPKTRVRGSLIMDAHLAALAIEHGATLCTNDRDFARFAGLRVEYPLQ